MIIVTHSSADESASQGRGLVPEIRSVLVEKVMAAACHVTEQYANDRIDPIMHDSSLARGRCAA
jgi:hypothetical protein